MWGILLSLFSFKKEVGQLEWPPRCVPLLVRLPENLGKKPQIPIDGCSSYPGRTSHPGPGKSSNDNRTYCCAFWERPCRIGEMRMPGLRGKSEVKSLLSILSRKVKRAKTLLSLHGMLCAETTDEPHPPSRTISFVVPLCHTRLSAPIPMA